MGTVKKKFVLTGVFENAEDARETIRELRDAGFSDKEIGLLSHDKHGNPEVTSFKDLEGNKAGTGAAVGAAAGAGGGLLWGLGIAAGFLPAIGPVIAGGILAALAASAGVGAGAGLVVGALAGLGVSDEEAAYYDAEFRRGRTIVVVQGDHDADTAYRILQERRSMNPYLQDPMKLGPETTTRRI